MNVEKIKKIAVMKSTIMFLRLTFIFPNDQEINQPEKNVFIKYTTLYIMGLCFPIGVVVHLLKKLRRNRLILNRERTNALMFRTKLCKTEIPPNITIPNENMHIVESTTFLDGDKNYMDEDITVLLSFCGVSYFTFQYFKSIKKIVNLCKQLSDFETFGKPKNFDYMNKLLNRISIFYYIYHVIDISLIMLSPVFLARNCRLENEKRGIDEVCGMVARLGLPFDYDFFPVKQILILYQYCVALLVYHNAGIISYAMFESIVHMSIRFHHLCDTFVELLKIEDPKERRRQFGKAVQYHYTLIELGNLITSSYGPCSIVHIILTAPVLGASGFRLVTTAGPDAIALFFGWIISTSLVCTGGQRLQDSSEILGDIIHQTEWYKVEKELQRDLVLVILRARHPIFLRAGPFGNMTYAMMVAIGKASYSYVTLLKQMM